MNVAKLDRNIWFLLFHVMLCLLTCLAFVGCSGETQSDGDKTNAGLSSPDNGSTTTSVLPDSSAGATSPAATISEIPDADASPETVCRRFMELLQTGNRPTAERLLTRIAYTVTSQADWQIPPVGGSEATFEMKAVRYATTKQRLAQADCKILEIIEGKNEESEITWMVRKKKAGWRIFGMLVQLYDDQPKDLISFENPADVAMIKETLANQHASNEADLPQTPEQTQADANSISQTESGRNPS